MKKMMSLFVTSFILSSVVCAEPAAVVTDAVASGTQSAGNVNNVPLDQNGEVKLIDSDEQAVSISPNMKVTSKKAHQSDDNLKINIEENYPQIQGKELTENAKQFNQAIEQVVNDEIMEFKKNVALDAPHMKTLPEEMRKNSFKVDYDIDLVKPKTSTIVSVRLSFEGMQAGRPHPYHTNKVINFDLTTGKMISLNELFKKNSKFLQLLATYTNNALNKKLKHDNWMVAQGTKPDVKNFKNWNLQNDSLLITFDEYQVAPYVYGRQEVEIPYSELKKVLSMQSPISDCAQNSKNCQIG